MDFETINPPSSFTGTDAFTDEKGTINKGLPSIHWTNSFESRGDGTKLTVDLQFESGDAMKKILDTGFDKGFEMGLENLDDFLAK